MDRIDLDAVHELQRNRFEQFQRGDLLLPWLLRPCVVKILMVVDGYPGSFLNVSFSHSYFGLSAVLDALRNQPDFFVRYQVTKAHRQTDSFKPDPTTDPVAHSLYGPDFEGFRFNQSGFDINAYDQVWLFGARADESGSESLQDGELEVLAQFMEGGGGVFATGDHADLGASLCKRIPRVRSMRKWTAAQGVPSASGPNRHDTNLKGSNTTYTFDDESDDLPMTTTLKYYPLSSYHAFLRRSAPHPVLCGKDGPIDILPDHPHEGEVLDTAAIDLTATYDAGSLNGVDEYPSLGGLQPIPEVIAWAHVQGDHTNVSDTNKGAANAKTFGAVGAYNGHQLDKGRVVVDSTWHHWFDVNLIGRPVANLDSPPFSAANPKTDGFNATASGQQALERINNYFRNVALWCTTKQKQRCLFLRSMWGLVLRYPAAERLQPSLPILLLGGVAYDAIGRAASQCTRTRWVFDWFLAELEPLFEKITDPCLTCPPVEILEKYVLGGITRTMLEHAETMQEKRTDEAPDEKLLAEILVRGVNIGIDELSNDVKKSSQNLDAFQDGLRRSIKAIPEPEEFIEP